MYHLAPARLVIALAAALAVACATSPTGRSQLVLYSDADLDQMGAASFEELKSKEPVNEEAATNRYVECVAEAIVATLGPAQQGDWEVRVFASEQVNAFALPGRKIGVYTGLLAVARTQDQLAAVIGHEVGHVLARHGNERISQATVAQVTQVAVATAVQSADMSSAAGQMVMSGLGIGTQVGVLLPFSRAHESEADTIGLDLMARAGFDPQASVALWQNMSKGADPSQKPPEWASTHPSNERRIADLELRMPEAVRVAEQARAAGRRPRCAPPGVTRGGG